MKLLFENWRAYLNEAEGKVIKRAIFKMDLNAETPRDQAATKDIDELFKVFHISKSVLGSTAMHARKKDAEPGFTFTPRMTDNPMKDPEGNTVEDDFTPRVSVGPTIKKCFEALMMAQGGEGYLYAADLRADSGDDVAVFDLQDSFENCLTKLSSDDNEFGEKFKFQKYLNHTFEKDVEPGAFGAPSQLPDEYQIDWKGCVPDAMQTGEDWLTEPTTLMLIGRVGVDQELMYLSPGASGLLQKLGFTLDVEDYREKK